MSHPVQIVTDAVAAIERGDWGAFIALCDPVSLRRFKNDLVWQFSDHGYSKGVTVEDFMEEMPDMPREVVEYNLAEMERYRDPSLRLQLEISTVSNLDELKRLEPHEVMIRWLQSRMLYRDDEFSIWKPAFVMLGSVRDGADFSHVLCRHASADDDTDEDESEDYVTPRDEKELDRLLRNRTHMLTAVCRRQPDGTWRLIAERNLFFLPMMSLAV